MDTHPDYFSFFPNYLLQHKLDKSLAQLLSKTSAKSVAELEKAEERKRRLQRERSRRYRASKVAKKNHKNGFKIASKREDYSQYKNIFDINDYVESLSDLDASIDEYTMVDLDNQQSLELKHNDNTFGSDVQELSMKIKELLKVPTLELDCSTLHKLIFHWLQT